MIKFQFRLVMKRPVWGFGLSKVVSSPTQHFLTFAQGASSVPRPSSLRYTYHLAHPAVRTRSSPNTLICAVAPDRARVKCPDAHLLVAVCGYISLTLRIRTPAMHLATHAHGTRVDCPGADLRKATCWASELAKVVSTQQVNSPCRLTAQLSSVPLLTCMKRPVGASADRQSHHSNTSNRHRRTVRKREASLRSLVGIGQRAGFADVRCRSPAVQCPICSESAIPTRAHGDLRVVSCRRLKLPDPIHRPSRSIRRFGHGARVSRTGADLGVVDRC